MRLIRPFITLAVAAALLVPLPGHASVVVERTPIEIAVTNPVGLTNMTVHGGLFQAEGQTECANSVLLLVHGLSYGEYAWDFPVEPETYSTARMLAAAGYPVVAIDLPGYQSAQPDTADNPDGYSLTIEGYADMVGQVEKALRFGDYGVEGGPSFTHVGVMGHSAGTEIIELSSGLGYMHPDALIATGYHHVPSQRIVTDFFTGDYLRAAESDYEYFGGTEQGRTEYMYAPLPSDNVDPAIVAADNELANGTPSGEIYSIGPQPSKAVMANIVAPVLFVLGDTDLLFERQYADAELNLFARAASVESLIVPNAGHSFMLHKNAPQTGAAVIDWLSRNEAAIPGC